MKPPILKPWHSVVQPVDQKACVLADIAISKGNGGLDVFNGYRLCFYLHRQATPRERIISTVGIFSEKGKASLSQPAEARSCPLRFRRGKTSHTSGLARRKIFPIPFPVYHISQVCLVDFCRDLHFSHSMLWGETFFVSALSNHLHAGNWAAPEGGFFWEALTKKIPATSAGTKTSE